MYVRATPPASQHSIHLVTPRKTTSASAFRSPPELNPTSSPSSPASAAAAAIAGHTEHKTTSFFSSSLVFASLLVPSFRNTPARRKSLYQPNARAQRGLVFILSGQHRRRDRPLRRLDSLLLLFLRHQSLACPHGVPRAPYLFGTMLISPECSHAVVEMKPSYHGRQHSTTLPHAISRAC